MDIERTNVMTEEAIVSNPTVSEEVTGEIVVLNSMEAAPLTSTSLKHFSPERQQEIVALSGSIDVIQIEKIMSYGQLPLLKSFERSGKILEAKQGSTADQEVMKQVIELAKQANESYEDFNLELKEPNLFQKIVLSLMPGAKNKRESDLKVKAVTNYNFLQQLAKSSEEWIAILEEDYGQITMSAEGDRDDAIELEEYIVAGRIAEERITGELVALKTEWEETGLTESKEKYEMMEEGLEIFRTVLLNLEKSRAAFAISIAQLKLQRKTNKNIQVAVRSQRANSMALAAQQLRNAVLDAENRAAIEGQRSITRLNDELIKKVATNSVLTAEESEKILMNGVYTVESALIAAKTVIDGCKQIEKARGERDGVIVAEMAKLKTLFEELTPFVDDVKEIATKNGNTTSASTKSNGLVF